MNPIDTFLKRLEVTQGDTHAQSALTAEFMLLHQPEAERNRLREALDAAAVLRWFDAELLEKVLGIPGDAARLRFEALKTWPFVETYRSGSDELYNLHESTRLGWRKKLAHEQLQRFRALSLSASVCFADDTIPAGRIEWIYQLLCGAPEKGATELENLNREWSSRARPEDRNALAVALRELEETQLVAGRARCWTLLVIAWVRDMRGETAQLADVAYDTLRLARECKDSAAEAEAQCLLGDIKQAQGQLAAALVAHNKSLAISGRLAAQDPGNTGRQREVAGALNRVGGVLEAQGQLVAAQTAYNESLAIFQRLTELEPSNAGWQRDLAVALNWVGSGLQAQGQLAAALAAYNASLTICQRLAAQDPSNAGWQREVAVALSWVGSGLQAQGQLAAAQAAYNEYLTICQRLAAQDPGNAGLQRDLAVGHNRVGSVLQAQGQLAAAQAAYNESLAIYQRLTELDPSNAQWQQDLLTARSWAEGAN